VEEKKSREGVRRGRRRRRRREWDNGQERMPRLDLLSPEKIFRLKERERVRLTRIPPFLEEKLGVHVGEGGERAVDMWR